MQREREGKGGGLSSPVKNVYMGPFSGQLGWEERENPERFSFSGCSRSIDDVLNKQAKKELQDDLAADGELDQVSISD